MGHSGATLMYTLLVLVMMSCVQPQCDINEPQQDCITLFNHFQQALVKPSRHNNLFRLQAAFYPPSRLTPTLLNVTYNLNVTCTGFEESCIICNQTKGPYIMGWTPRGLYQYFHPAVINLLRFQLPFSILQLTQTALAENLDVDAFLWDGTSVNDTLPSVNISLDVMLSLENFTSSCPDADTVQKALVGVNQWLRALARFAGRGEDAIMWASGEDKGFTLPRTSVELYNRTALSDNESIFGNNILVSSYIITFLLTLLLVAISLPPMVVMFKNTFIDAEGAPHIKFYWAAGSSLAFMYLIVTVTIEFDHLQHVHSNIFALLKLIFLMISFLYFILSWLGARHFLTECSHILGAVFVVGSISTFAAIILLSLAPTIILLFVYPVDTSSLLSLHIALFYTSTIIMAIIFNHIYCWIANANAAADDHQQQHQQQQHGQHQQHQQQQKQQHGHQKQQQQQQKQQHGHQQQHQQQQKQKKQHGHQKQQQQWCDHGNKFWDNACCSINPSPSWYWCYILLIMVFVTLLLPIIYISFVLLYQLIIVRSEYSGAVLTFNDVTKYIPTVIVGGFGFWLKKGTFLQPQAENENEDEERKKAKKWWTTLGEYLQPRDPVQNNDDDDDNARKHAVAIWIDLGKRLKDEPEPLTLNNDNAHKYLCSHGIKQLLDLGGGDKKAHSDRLEKVLRKKKLKLIPVKGDGNCCFGAVAEALKQLPSHINLSQLLGCEVHSQMDLCTELRKLAVQEWTTHSEVYQPFLVDKDIKEEIQKFTQRGFYDSDLGDSIVLALSNALQLPILMFTSIPRIPEMEVLPRSQLDTDPLKIAYNQSPPSHYDCVASATAISQ